MRHLGSTAALLLASGLAACERSSATTPWLTYPGVDGHSRFLLLAGTPHDPSVPPGGGAPAVTCNDCHGGSSFAQFDCLGCHAHSDQTALASLHLGAGVTGFSYDSPSCYRCHPDGLGVPADHSTRLFPIGTPSHPAVCTSCHTDLSNRIPATLACASCHAGQPAFAGKHGGVKDFPASPASADCVRCHADDQVNRVADHQAQFPIASGSATHDTACLACHPQLRTDKAWGTDFNAFSCTGCHQDPATSTAHAGIGGYLYDSASCYGCHPTGSAAPPDHTPKFFPIGTGTAHAGVGCTQCHTDLAHPTDPANFACAACHLQDPQDPGFSAAHTSPPSGVSILAVHTSQTASTELPLTSPNCLRCHADAQVDAIASHPTGDRTPSGNSNHRGAGCLTCHTAVRADKPFGVDFGASPGAGCLVCHPGGIPD
jgi:hypothetical protein